MTVANRQSEFQTVDILKPGMSPSLPDRGVPWIQNLTRVDGAWETRPGWGVLCQFDTRLSAGKYFDVEPDRRSGLERHLGSHLINETSFGHKQVVSVWRASVSTNNMTFATGYGYHVTQYRKVYVVIIYDLTTDEKWEEVLHLHTSQEEGLLFRRHGQFETSIGQGGRPHDRQKLVDAGVNEGQYASEFNDDRAEYFFFAEVPSTDAAPRLIFGSERAGAWVYCPSDFKASEYDYRERWQQTQNEATCDWRDPYSESPVIHPLRVTNGDFFDDGKGLTYVTQAVFGTPQAACVLGERVCYASGNILFFSDPENPAAISANNFQAFPDKIVAVAQTLGNLLVWTDSATYYYNPAVGSATGLISGGTVTTVSSNVGILSSNCWVNVDGAVFWLDRTGIWKNFGNVTASKVSDELDAFFVYEGLSNPLTSFYTASGANAFGPDDPPRTFYNWNADVFDGCNVAHNPSEKRIFFNVPKLDLCFVLQPDGWHVWSNESVVSVDPDRPPFGLAPTVRAQRNLPFGWYLCDDDREVYMVSGPTRQQWDNDTVNGGLFPSTESQQLASGLLCRLGRGGGVDRTVGHTKEDRRRAVGEYVHEFTNEVPAQPAEFRDTGYVYFDKVRIPPVGRTFNWTALPPFFPPVTVGPLDAAVELPIKLVPSSELHATRDRNIVQGNIVFKFDNIHWKPYINANNSLGNTNEAVFNLPPERLGAVAGFFLGSADTGLNQGVYVTNNAGAADPNGNTIHILFNGTPGGWANAPEFNFTPRFKNELLSLYFRRIAPGDCWDLGIQVVRATFVRVLPAVPYNVAARVWKDHTPPDNLTLQPDTKNFQAVDWTYSGQRIDGPNDMALKLRGIDTVLQSSGFGAALVGKDWQAWPVRLFNAIFSTNYKQFAAQFVDELQSSPKAVVNFLKTTLRSRVQTVSPVPGPQVLVPPTWNQAGIKWGDATAAGNGDFQIGDGPQDRVRASADVKGEGVAVQLFGHVMGAAERIRIVSAAAAVRITGGLRRRGRP